MKKLVAGLLLSLCTIPVHAWDGGHWKNNRARGAVARGEVAPYSDVEKKISQVLKGRIILVELEEDDDIWVYELRLLADNGRIIEVELDGKSLMVLGIEGKGLEDIIKRP